MLLSKRSPADDLSLVGDSKNLKVVGAFQIRTKVAEQDRFTYVCCGVRPQFPEPKEANQFETENASDFCLHNSSSDLFKQFEQKAANNVPDLIPQLQMTDKIKNLKLNLQIHEIR